ncbi:DUF2971 domain-containing protein [Bradyrhizobium sp. NAS96.2]|uniref:DUF2971 domain-containing protein n=1 Tax=Bradyrhizobium sp. NAS96.2 TaxID=1680160 RepID=UPI00093B6EB3|nr:DUF2971 domain-containing protein [Bradyrhizobium sp. NAS96.2]OKO69943.1 hypothetical protein AC628_32205 [Bradyrhizobium sp. NAS96.2]
MTPEDFLVQFNGYHLDSVEHYVYRYRTADRALMEIEKRTLRLSPFPELNDPKEFARWHFGFMSAADFGEINWPDLEEQATAYAKNFAKVLCTTLDDSTALDRGDVNSVWGRGFSRPRMWQQYAENYCGACMVFDRAALDAAIRATVPKGSKLFVDRVRYANTPRIGRNHPLLNPFVLNYDRIKSLGMARAMTEHAEIHWQALFFDKALDWQTEQEYRWLVWDTEHKEIIFDFSDAMKAVVIGETFPRLNDLHDLCEPLKVPVWEMRWKNGSPEPSPIIRLRPRTIA